MLRILLLLGVIFIITPSSLGLDGHQAKCSITEGNGIKVDTCDASKFLSCQAGRCMCNDLGNQLFDYRLEAAVTDKPHSRTKRGTKKKIVAGAVGGAAIGYIVGKSVNKGSKDSKKKDKLTKVYSCYGRVGSPCVMDYNNVNIVPIETTTTTTTTTAVPTSISPVGNSSISVSTTTTVSSSSSSLPVVVDLSKIPKCVRNAICTRPNKQHIPVGPTTGHVEKTDTDPRIGVCMCDSGYKASNTDKCEKSASLRIEFGISSLLTLSIFVVSGKIIF